MRRKAEVRYLIRSPLRSSSEIIGGNNATESRKQFFCDLNFGLVRAVTIEEMLLTSRPIAAAGDNSVRRLRRWCGCGGGVRPDFARAAIVSAVVAAEAEMVNMTSAVMAMAAMMCGSRGDGCGN